VHPSHQPYLYVTQLIAIVLPSGEGPFTPSWSTARWTISLKWYLTHLLPNLGCHYLLTLMITLPELWWKAASDTFLDKVLAHPGWPVRNNLLTMHFSVLYLSLDWHKQSDLNEVCCDFWQSAIQWLNVTCDWPYNLATWLWPSSSHMVCTESILHWPGSLCCKSIQVWPCIFILQTSANVEWSRQCHI